MRRIGWFILLWFVGAGSLALVAAAIRLAIA